MIFKKIYMQIGKKQFGEYLIFGVFLLFFYLPLLNLAMLAFANKYEVPAVIPQEFGLKWWNFVLQQSNLVSSIATSLGIAMLVTIVSLFICIPAAYALARMEFRGKKIFMLSFLLSNAYPKMGLYISIGMIFYKLNLMGTLQGVLLIHILNTMMFMTWIPMGSFRSVHKQQEEAARDSGAGALRTFIQITLPMSMPGIIVASIFTFLASIEEAQGTLLVGFPQIQTMPVVLYGIIMEYPTTAGPVLSIILIIPSILILILARKFLGADVISKGFTMK